VKRGREGSRTAAEQPRDGCKRLDHYRSHHLQRLPPAPRGRGHDLALDIVQFGEIRGRLPAPSVARLAAGFVVPHNLGHDRSRTDSWAGRGKGAVRRGWGARAAGVAAVLRRARRAMAKRATARSPAGGGWPDMNPFGDRTGSDPAVSMSRPGPTRWKLPAKCNSARPKGDSCGASGVTDRSLRSHTWTGALAGLVPVPERLDGVPVLTQAPPSPGANSRYDVTPPQT